MINHDYSEQQIENRHLAYKLFGVIALTICSTVFVVCELRYQRRQETIQDYFQKMPANEQIAFILRQEPTLQFSLQGYTIRDTLNETYLLCRDGDETTRISRDTLREEPQRWVRRTDQGKCKIRFSIPWL